MNLVWINAPGLQLAIVPRPRGGDWLLDDLRNLQAAGIDVLISLLTEAEAAELELSSEAQANSVPSHTAPAFLAGPLL
jgi:hypothetical protein